MTLVRVCWFERSSVVESRVEAILKLPELGPSVTFRHVRYK